MLFYNATLGCMGSFATLFGLYTYNRYSSQISYRAIIVVSNTVFSLLHLADMVLFSRMNVQIGIPDCFFAFGNQSLGTMIYQWLWMPQVGLFSQLCPKDMEASMFALVVSCHNLGVAISSALGAWLLASLSCNPRGAAMETSEFQHLWIASGVSSLLPLLGISALFSLVPDVRPGEEISTQLQRGDGTAGSLWRRWRSESCPPMESDSEGA